MNSFKTGDRVQESPHRIPTGCKPFHGIVTFVADDGWTGIRMDGMGTTRDFSFAPGEVIAERGDEDVSC